MWPLNRADGSSGRSRFTGDPGRRSPRLDRRRVSGARSAEKPSGRKSTAVRQTPLTATLAPSFMSLMTVSQRTARRDPAVTTVPSSSMIPVNIYIPFHRKFIGRDLVDGDLMHPDRVRAAPSSDAAGERQRFEAAQN